MATEAQINANRRNAEKSTGPRTAEGTERCKFNAATHTLCSHIALMQDEKNGGMGAEFKRLQADLTGEHQPATPTEEILVYKMAECFFAAQRAQVLLADALDSNDLSNDAIKQVSLMLRYHTTNDRAFGRHLADLRKQQKERQLKEIGSVPQNAEPAPPADPPYSDDNPETDYKPPFDPPKVVMFTWEPAPEPVAKPAATANVSAQPNEKAA